MILAVKGGEVLGQAKLLAGLVRVQLQEGALEDRRGGEGCGRCGEGWGWVGRVRWVD